MLGSLHVSHLGVQQILGCGRRGIVEPTPAQTKRNPTVGNSKALHGVFVHLCFLVGALGVGNLRDTTLAAFMRLSRASAKA